MTSYCIKQVISSDLYTTPAVSWSKQNNWEIIEKSINYISFSSFLLNKFTIDTHTHTNKHKICMKI